jgi:3-oxoadipate enol-lactonase
MTEFAYRGSDGSQLFAAAVGDAGERAAGIGCSVLVLLHGGGPDHRSLLPLAERLADLCTVVLPDIRGYGASICTDPFRHTWARYAEDVFDLLNHLDVPRAIVGGAGLGATITLRAALAYPERILGSVLISIEDIENDEQKQAEIAFMDAFAVRVRTEGMEAAWAPILRDLAPVVGAMVRDAIPRSDSASIAAAASIGRDRAFHSLDELVGITSPTLIFPGMDWRHPPALAEHLARLLAKGRLAPATLSADVLTAHDFAGVCAPAIRDFITDTIGLGRSA